MPEQPERRPSRFGRFEEHGEAIPSGPARPLHPGILRAGAITIRALGSAALDWGMLTAAEKERIQGEKAKQEAALLEFEVSDDGR